jgi:hypothetical protein
VSEFEEYAYAAISSALEAVPAAEVEDVYVVSLFDYSEEEDPRQPTLTLGFNTEARVRAHTPIAYDEDEARWNYACWLQNRLVVMGDSMSDPEGAQLRDAWVRGLGVWYADAAEEAEIDAAIERIEMEFQALAIRIVQRLHSSGLVERAFGRPIPVLIHELEYYDKIAEQNERANPPELVADFSRWVLRE